jgi:competence ComEA-like helix-hairpin-helix protein
MRHWLQEHHEGVTVGLLLSLVFATILGAVLLRVKRPTPAPIVIQSLTPLLTSTSAPAATLVLPAAAPDAANAGLLALPGHRININTASASELETLPGIGPVLAQRVVEYRQSNGPFRTPEDIKDVKGIGDGIFAEIKDSITVE